jgi:hypothetical protein
LANHFVSGGVGVRFIADVSVNCHLRKPVFDRETVEAELSRFGLLEFAGNIENLAELWFGRGENTPILEALGEYILSGGQYGTAGIPDIIVCYKGRFYGLEAKVGKNKPTRLQAATIEQIKRAGGTAAVVRSVDDVKAVLSGKEENDE